MRIYIEEVGKNSLDRVNKILSGIERGAIKAVHNSLKRAGETAKTQAARFAAEQYVISKGTFMSKVRITPKLTANSTGVTSMELRFTGGGIPLISFNVRYSRGGKLSAKVMRGGGGPIDSAFAARVFGPVGVFERIGKSRFPVEQKFGPSTAHMMRNEDVLEKMEDTIVETYDKRLEQEIYRLLNGFGG